ncbi:MAG: serine hydrolase [Chitinophagaceae bacterium]|nr:serine hydrolase [Chitinophagaceae bacterium]
MPYRKKISTLFFAVCLVFQISVYAQPSVGSLPRSKPEAEAVSTAAINNFIDAAGKSKNEFHSFMLLRHGKVIAEGWWNPYKPALKHTMYSVSKSFTSSAVGFAVSEGRFALDDKVISFFPELIKPDTVKGLLASLTVKDLITMSAGQSPDPSRSVMMQQDWIKAFLSTAIADTPGTKFLYNSAATFMLSAIVQKVTGEKILNYLTPRLFEPLSITGIDWEENPQHINAGGWGLRLKTEDMAKFGQLYLQKGKWNGKQILSANWIEEATSFKIKNAADTAISLKAKSDWAQGYCYQFWRCRNNAFRADGAFGQYIIVMPDQDAVIAITSETANMQSIMDMVWEYLLPGMSATERSNTDISKKLAALSIAAPSVSANPSIAAKISGKIFVMNDSTKLTDKVSFSFKNNTCTYTVTCGGKAYSFVCGNGKWITGETSFLQSMPSLTAVAQNRLSEFTSFKVACAYSWQDENTLLLSIRYIESPHTDYIYCHFDGNQVSMYHQNSIQRIAGSNDKPYTINGKMIVQ